LSEHREDIPSLAADFARRYADRFGMENVRLSAALVEALRSADWPGNVRQLENTIARLIALQGGSGEIGVESFRATAAATSDSAGQPAESTIDAGLSLREQVEAFERSIIARTLAAVSGNQSEAARRLALSRSSFVDRLKKYGFSGGGPDSTS
jgi:two-component system response regulator AtoC